MSKLLAELLQASQPKFSLAVADLERGSGNRSLDVGLTADIIEAVHQKHRELGLDKQDTTGPELYMALKDLFILHDTFLTSRLRLSNEETLPSATIKIQKVLYDNDLLHSVWTVKSSRIKQIAKTLKPKRALKKLGYRSLDSFLRRETAAQIIFAIHLFESNTIQDQFKKKMSRLKQSDFEERPIVVDAPNSKHWRKIAEDFAASKKHNIALVKEVSAIIALPVPIRHLPGSTLLLTALILYYANELKTISAQALLCRLDSAFGEKINEILYSQSDKQVLPNTALKTDWRVLHRYYGKHGSAAHFEPHLQPEDLQWRSAEDSLFKLEPALYFWYNLDYVGWSTTEGIVSCNLLDVALNVANKLPFERRAVHHMQDSLWNELYLRYLAQSPLEQSLLKRLVPYNVEEALEL